jgi:hypothetical protein
VSDQFPHFSFYSTSCICSVNYYLGAKQIPSTWSVCEQKTIAVPSLANLHKVLLPSVVDHIFPVCMFPWYSGPGVDKTGLLWTWVQNWLLTYPFYCNRNICLVIGLGEVETWINSHNSQLSGSWLHAICGFCISLVLHQPYLSLLKSIVITLNAQSSFTVRIDKNCCQNYTFMNQNEIHEKSIKLQNWNSSIKICSKPSKFWISL